MSELLRRLCAMAIWVCVACVGFSLPLQAVSAVIAGVLGPRHIHPTTESSRRVADPTVGGKGSRHAGHEHGAASTLIPRPHSMVEPHAHARAEKRAHSQLHEAGLRHHHAHDDPGKVDLETPADGEGAASASPQTGAAFLLAVPAELLAPLPRPLAVLGGAWGTSAARSFTSALLRRIERPPRSASD